ncbi:hypothetical protein CTAYLR_002139 [Chrysophaeum taylorii]|uniref:Arylamine N-acetyltransferase n=1 Tax=Chrysophaeum taylorii TaxID=2483200 RepID=A0AAD7XU83_9STRA|nr:hypothetical protein CTAYLR_002139 [Chrysophaeum taylorii]
MWRIVDGVELSREKYLDRLGLRLDDLDFETNKAQSLNELIAAHLDAVPFENIDTYGGGRWISLDVGDAYEKIVCRRRGGFCYEVNILFCWLLRRLGYDARLVMARVYRGTDSSLDSSPAPKDDIRSPQNDLWDGENPPTHAAIVVENEYLCDVGFGEPPRVALELGAQEQRDGQHAYRFVCTGRLWALERRSRGATGLGGIRSAPGTWEPRLLFDLDDSRPPAHFEAGLYRVQTNADLIFKQYLFCVRQARDAKFVLQGTTLRVTPFYDDDDDDDDELQTADELRSRRTESTFETPGDLIAALGRTFGTDIDAADPDEARCIRLAVDRAFENNK